MGVRIQRAGFTAAIHSPHPLSQPEFSLQKALAKSLSTQPQSTLCLSLGECITASFLHTEPSLEISTMTPGSWAQSVFSSVLFLISSLINLSHPLLSTHSIDPTNHYSPPSLDCRKGPEICRPELPSTLVSPYLIASSNSTISLHSQTLLTKLCSRLAECTF